LVSFQFPDPWRREKHKKRLLIQRDLVGTLGKFLQTGGCVYLSTDCNHIASRMMDVFNSSSTFELLTKENYTIFSPHFSENTFVFPDSNNPPSEYESEYFTEDGWLKFNPLGCPSERELVCENQW
jgi:tRNA G46 methylase TrmB